MLVQAFFDWIETAQAGERAQAVTTLARAYLAGAHGGDSPEDIEAALTYALDDTSPVVRRALAMVLADRPDAPRALVHSLSRDQAEVAGLLIARSPLLAEADLLDLAASVERLSLVAIALRREVTPRVAAAVIARGERDALHALLHNRQAEIAPGSLIEVAAAHGAEPRLREAMLARSDLPPEARHLLMRAVAETLGTFIGAGGFLAPARQGRAMAEALETGTLTIAASAGEALPDFVDHLRERAELTPALLLRAVLEGDTRFVAVALAELCALPPRRVEALIAGRSEAGLGALVRKAGLPDFLVPVMIAALSAAVRQPEQARNGLRLDVIRAAQSAIVANGREDSLRLLALLRRYEAEAARHASRLLAQTLRARAAANAVVLLAPPAADEDMLRLTAFAGEEQVACEETEAEPAPEPACEMRRGLVLDEPIPDLASLIAQWKAENAAKDAVAACTAQNENAAPEAPDAKENAA